MLILAREAATRRAALLDAIAAECGVAWLPLPAQGPWPAAAEGQRVLSVQWAGNGFDPACVRAAAARGAVVVVVDEQDPPAPIGERCRWLLAGAQCVIDGSAAECGAELRASLAALVKAEAGKSSEDGRLRAVFAGLGLVGRSEASLAAFRRIEKIARFSDLPALILGETGTGKELAARALHRLDPKRRDHPFVAVNCGAVPLELAESEFFGHRKGAFTGADRDRRGLVRAAQGGVLFLDEVGDLPLGLQAKLLRVLQERRVLGLGEDRESEVDLRVVAATHRDLRRMVDEGRFREDLYHRLKLLPVELPPLRSRPEDLPPLVEHFIARHAGAPLKVGAAFLEALTRLALRGNARELENIVRSALIEKGHGATLGLADLPPEAWDELGRETGAAPPDPDAQAEAGLSLAESLARCERQVLEAAMRRAHNNQSQAAQLLGVTPRSVYNMLRRHHLQP